MLLENSFLGLEVGAHRVIHHSRASFEGLLSGPVTLVEFAFVVWRRRRGETSPPRNFTMRSHNQNHHPVETMDIAESVRGGLSATRSFDISLDMGDSTSQVSRTGSQTSISSSRPTSSHTVLDDDMALVLLELGLTAEERKDLEVRTNEERSSISRVKTEEWMDKDEFLWSPSGC